MESELSRFAAFSNLVWIATALLPLFRKHATELSQ
jgi:hypothetical protein